MANASAGWLGGGARGIFGETIARPRHRLGRVLAQEFIVPVASMLLFVAIVIAINDSNRPTSTLEMAHAPHARFRRLRRGYHHSLRSFCPRGFRRRAAHRPLAEIDDVVGRIKQRALEKKESTKRPEVWANGTYSDNAFDLAMTTAFRIVMGFVAGWQSKKPFIPTKPGESYEGLVEVAQALQLGKGSAAFEAAVVEILDRFPRHPQLLQNNKISMELLAFLTPKLFNFLVGPSEVEAWNRTDGTVWQSSVKIQKCRFLTETNCAGMCVGLCQRPTQKFFNEVAGIPVSMEPNFEDCSCTMTWGKAPQPRNADPASNQPCFEWCPSVNNDRQSGAASPCPRITQPIDKVGM